MRTAAERKAQPLASGVLDYFPDALLAVAEVSRVGNEQHHPGAPLHWDKSKSSDEADALMRHLVDRGKRDTDGMRHSAKVAWRALALLQRELDAEAKQCVDGTCDCDPYEPDVPFIGELEVFPEDEEAANFDCGDPACLPCTMDRPFRNAPDGFGDNLVNGCHNVNCWVCNPYGRD